MSKAYRCEECDAEPPIWRIIRKGDVLLTWACDKHLVDVCYAMQRDWEKRTELILTRYYGLES